MDSQLFTIQELMLYNGDARQEKYIAFEGIVYDVTECPKWRSTMHESLHFPGQDLTNELVDAPHLEEVFTRPCVKIVGKLSPKDA